MECRSPSQYTESQTKLSFQIEYHNNMRLGAVWFLFSELPDTGCSSGEVQAVTEVLHAVAAAPLLV